MFYCANDDHSETLSEQHADPKRKFKILTKKNRPEKIPH